MAALARHVGIVPSGIYRHFKDKNEVMDAVLAFIHARLMANAQALEADSDDTLTRLHALFVRHISLIRDNKAIPQVVFSDDVFGGRPTRRKGLYHSIQQYLGAVAKVIAQGQDQGAIRPDIPARALAVQFLGLVQPAAIIYSLSGGAFNIRQHAATAWRVFEEAIRQAPAKGGKRQNDGEVARTL